MKGAGYAISTGAVVLLALPAWKGAQGEPWLLAALAGGVALSLVGMIVRYLAHKRAKARSRALADEVERMEDGPAP